MKNRPLDYLVGFDFKSDLSKQKHQQREFKLKIDLPLKSIYRINLF